jgi:ferredoxin
MSKKDGKSVLLHAQEKKGFYTLKTPDGSAYQPSKEAAKACPVNIITTKLV